MVYALRTAAIATNTHKMGTGAMKAPLLVPLTVGAGVGAKLGCPGGNGVGAAVGTAGAAVGGGGVLVGGTMGNRASNGLTGRGRMYRAP